MADRTRRLLYAWIWVNLHFCLLQFDICHILLSLDLAASEKVKKVRY